MGILRNKESTEIIVNTIYTNKIAQNLENLLTVNFIYTLYLQKRRYTDEFHFKNSRPNKAI